MSHYMPVVNSHYEIPGVSFTNSTSPCVPKIESQCKTKHRDASANKSIDYSGPARSFPLSGQVVTTHGIKIHHLGAKMKEQKQDNDVDGRSRGNGYRRF
jgi:hypothetical protein